MVGVRTLALLVVLVAVANGKSSNGKEESFKEKFFTKLQGYELVPGTGPNLLDPVTNFTIALVRGVQTSATITSQCLAGFTTLQNNLSAFGDVVFGCALIDFTSCGQLPTAGLGVVATAGNFVTGCNYSGLATDIGNLATFAGWSALYMNLYYNQMQLRQAWNNLMTAYQNTDYSGLGYNLGVITRLAFSFSVK